MARVKRTDITAVARTSGVSTTTVSRVINGVKTVSDRNRESVLAAVRKLNYRPNPSAQRLAAGKTNTMGLVIPRFSGMFQSFYAMEVLKGIGVGAERLHCDLLLHISNGTALPNPASVDGLLFVDVDGSEDLLDRAINEASLPIVVMNHYLEDLPVSCVAVDNRAAAQLAVAHLTQLGHKDIASITGDLKTQAGLDRMDGFLNAMRERQLPVKEGYIQQGNFTLPSVREATRRLLKLTDRPTAIFIASDDMALEAINILIEGGVRVPEEISVIGFDDNPIAAHGRVPLTTIRQPLADMGRIAVETLQQHILGKRKSPTKLLLSTTLVERQSCRQTWLEHR